MRWPTIGGTCSVRGGCLGREEDVVSLHVALAKRVGEQHLFHAQGVDILAGTDEEIATAVTAASKVDVVILALGEAA